MNSHTSLIKSYISLTKPGIIYGNAITAAAGFFLASKGHNNYRLFLATLIGLSFIIASACVFNNYIDRNIDKKMERTKNRVLVKGFISGRNAIIYASLLVLVGVFILSLYTNLLTVCIALVGFFFYVILYGIGKRRSIHGTIIGSISGAVPPVVGYCAVSNRFDIGAIIIGMILVFWQMPHFFAIAIYRRNDYATASIPVLPVKKGVYITKIHMLLYIIAFIIATCMLTVLKFTGYIYLIVTVLFGLAWLLLCINGFTTLNNNVWARTMFIFSLITIITFCVMTSVDAGIPPS